MSTRNLDGRCWPISATANELHSNGGSDPFPYQVRCNHSDRGSQYLSIKYSARRIEPSVGSVADSYDNALAETRPLQDRGHSPTWPMAQLRHSGICHLRMDRLVQHPRLQEAIPSGRRYAVSPRGKHRAREGRSELLRSSVNSNHGRVVYIYQLPADP